MRVLVFEPDHSGHRFTYLRLLLPAMAELCPDPILTTSRAALGSPEYAAQLALIQGSFTIDASLEPIRGKPLHVALGKLEAFRRALETHRPDHVYIPYADGLTQILAAARLVGRFRMPPGVESEGLLLRGGFAYPQRSVREAIRSRASAALLRRAPWTLVHHLDPIPFEQMIRAGGSIAARSRLMPDPVEPMPPLDRAAARRRLNLPEDGRYIGCTGTLDERKGVDLLTDAFAAAKLRPDDRLLLAGRLSPAIREMLHQRHGDLMRAGRIYSFDRYLDDAEVDASVLAADLVCTPYRRHIGSASIVIRSAAAGRPVLASNFGWMDFVVNRFGLGRTCDVDNPALLAQAIERSLEESRDFVPTAGSRRLVEFHTAENFRLAWMARLRERLNLPAAPAHRTWSWVLGEATEASA